MESMTQELVTLGDHAHHLRNKAEQISSRLSNLWQASHSAASTGEASRRLPSGHETARLRRADAEVAAAKLDLLVKQTRAEWRGFVSDVEELLASLEAAPLLRVCPD